MVHAHLVRQNGIVGIVVVISFVSNWIINTFVTLGAECLCTSIIKLGQFSAQLIALLRPVLAYM